MTRLRISIAVVFLLFLVLTFGWGRAPQMTANNRKILEALQTAVSSKQTDWLEAVVVQVNEKREQKQMSDAEFNAIQGIVKKAKSGDWKSAQRDSFMLSEAQRPTSEDMVTLKNRQIGKKPSPN